ncbi:28710_t:CDS:2 [Gigaspora margarita]|uniref:28710_t:CDS:1 n=1 Tax=Gigaspora margarita TaxID=4874 RepID=A0ABM8W324_GIGMA|nr:28710_t:CDS:2 [Gigaspora margarita]
MSDKSTNSSKFRLLAISCISAKDIEYYNKHNKKIGPNEIQNIQNNRFTFHYFLVDTIAEDIKYIELYDLKTNQLVNTFQRQILYKLALGEFPNYYAVSNNGKLLAYLSFPIKGITIYSIECGLEIAELANILDTSIFRTIANYNRIFLYFFYNDKKLLRYFSETGFSSAVWAVWDIFSSLRDSVKLNQQNFILELPSIGDNSYYGQYVEKSNSCIVIYQKEENYDKLFIYNDLVVDKYFNLKESNKQVWNTRNLEDHEEHTQEFKIDKIYEPWLPIEPESVRLPKEDDIQYSFYLDEKMEKLLIIRYHTVQVWYRGTLKFIHSPLLFFEVPNISDIYDIYDWYPKKIEVMSIKYSKYACNTLEYFSAYMKKYEEIYVQMKTRSDFDDFIEQMRNIILKLIRWYPTEWRLLNIRFDLISALVKAGEYELVYYILSFEKPIHIPHLPWSDKENTSTMISNALSDNTMLAYLLEYYSNNAIHDIRWMNTVVDIIPELGIKDQGNYKFYAQKLFYSSCFCDKKFDLISFEILEVSPKSNDLLKVYIPITQLTPQNSKLDLQEIENLFSPRRYLSPKEVDYSPLIKHIKTGERDIFYENPLMGAVINWMCKELDNPFSNIINAILAVYDWSSISFDAWNFWLLTIISVIGSFIFVIILQNVIISFMSEAFSNVVEDNKRGLYCYQIDLVHEFALLEKSLEFSDLDSKFKDKIKAKYICFYDDPNITKSWKEKSEQIRLKPYPKTQTL